MPRVVEYEGSKQSTKSSVEPAMNIVFRDLLETDTIMGSGFTVELADLENWMHAPILSATGTQAPQDVSIHVRMCTVSAFSVHERKNAHMHIYRVMGTELFRHNVATV